MSVGEADVLLQAGNAGGKGVDGRVLSGIVVHQHVDCAANVADILVRSGQLLRHIRQCALQAAHLGSSRLDLVFRGRGREALVDHGSEVIEDSWVVVMVCHMYLR
jgi:hypothetical protein